MNAYERACLKEAALRLEAIEELIVEGTELDGLRERTESALAVLVRLLRDLSTDPDEY